MASWLNDVTEAELAVLQALWRGGSATIRQLTEALYPHDTEAKYFTVKQLLARLESKGYVDRDRSETVHRFWALVDRDGLVGRRLEKLAASICDGSISPLLSHLAKSESLTEEQRQSLLTLVRGLRPPSGGECGEEEPGERA